MRSVTTLTDIEDVLEIDTLTAGGDFQYEEIPSFAPEHFARIVSKDPLRRKALDKGLRELSGDTGGGLLLSRGHEGEGHAEKEQGHDGGCPGNAGGQPVMARRDARPPWSGLQPPCVPAPPDRPERTRGWHSYGRQALRQSARRRTPREPALRRDIGNLT